jgi:tetratricopeptide (TPR) repeat protein
VNADPRRAIAGPAHHIYHEATECSTVSLPGREFIVSDSLPETPIPSPGAEPASEPQARGASPHRSRLLLRLLLLTALTTALVWFWNPLIIQYRQARARMSLDKRREAETLDSLRAALRRDLDNPHTLLWLARTHRRLGDLPRTSLLLDRAETLGGDARRIELERRLVLAQSGRLGEVEPLLPDMLIDAGADGPDVCEAFVQGFFVNLRTAEALRLLDLWQESFPKDPQPYFMRAYLMRSLDKFTEAEQIYRQGLALAPDRTAMRRQLADILVETNQLDQAESELAQCLKETPDDPQVYFGLARCAYQRGNLAEVPPRLEETLQRAPDHYEARRLRGQLKLAEGQAAEALPDLEAVVAERPYDTLAREALGRSLTSLGRTDEAKSHLDFVVKAGEQLGRVDRLFRESLERPNDAELRYEIGSILLEYGSPDDAARWLRAALELQPDHAGAHRALATYNEARGDAAGASFHRLRANADQREP